MKRLVLRGCIILPVPLSQGVAGTRKSRAVAAWRQRATRGGWFFQSDITRWISCDRRRRNRNLWHALWLCRLPPCWFGNYAAAVQHEVLSIRLVRSVLAAEMACRLQLHLWKVTIKAIVDSRVRLLCSTHDVPPTCWYLSLSKIWLEPIGCSRFGCYDVTAAPCIGPCSSLCGKKWRHSQNRKYKINCFKKTAVLWLTHFESGITIANIYQSLPHVVDRDTARRNSVTAYKNSTARSTWIALNGHKIGRGWAAWV